MDKPVIVSAFHHPFKSERATHIAPVGASIAEMIRESDNLDQLLLTAPGVRAFIDDRLVPRHEWETARPAAGQLVTIKVTPTGGDDSGGKDFLRIIATIAVIAISIYAPYAAGLTTVLESGATVLSTSGVALSFAISTVGMLAINALIPPQMPKTDAASGSSTGPDIYSIRGTRNTVDPWGVCNKIYGRHKVYPKYAALPYTEMLGDEQYLRCLFDIGQIPLHTEFDTIKIGETDINSFTGVQIQFYQSNTQIDNVLNFNAGAIYPFQVKEENLSIELEYDTPNIRTTSEDVEEIQVELTFPQGLYTWNRNDGNRYAAGVNFDIDYAPTGTTNWVNIGNEQIIRFYGNPGSSTIPIYDPSSSWYDPYSPFQAGYTVRGQNSGAEGAITWSNPTNGYFPNPDYDPNKPSYDFDPEGRKIYNDNDPTVILQYITELRVNKISGTFAASEPIIFYGRLNGAAFPGYVSSNYDSLNGIWGRKTSTYRYGVEVKVPKGQYDVRVRRLTLEERADTVDTAYWTALRGLRFTAEDGSTAIPVLARDRMLVAMRVKASGQLNGIIDQFNLIVQATIPVFDGYRWVYRNTRNPAWAYTDVLRGLACSNPVPDERIDLDKIIAWANRNTAAGRTFDAVIDFQKPRLELLADIATTGRASFGMKDNKVSVVEDLSQSVPVAHIGPRNSWGYKGKKVFTDLPHAFRCRFINADKDFVADEIDVYDDGYNKTNATKFEILDSWGITTATNVAREARYMIAQARLRPETHQVYQDVENLVVTRGDLVRFSHDVILVGLGNARVKSLDYDEYSRAVSVEVDDAFTMETGKSYCCRFRLSDGSSVYAGVATNAGDNYVFDFNTPIPAVNAPSVGDLVFFGESGLETINCIATRIEAGNDLTAKVTMVDDSPAVRSADQTLPEWESHITQPPVSNRVPPGVVIIATDYSAYDSNVNDDGTYRAKVTVSFGLTAGINLLPQDIQGFQYEWRIVGDTWQSDVLPSSARSFTIEAINNQTYEIRIRSYSSPGLYSAWATTGEIEIAIVKIKPPNVKNLRVSGGIVPEGGSELGGGSLLVQEFVGRDCEVTWSPVYGGTTAGSKIDGYKIEIRRTDESVLRTEFTTEIHYNYSFEKNRDDNGGNPIRSFKFYVWAHNVWEEISAVAASITVANPAPNMGGVTPSIVERYGYLEVNWPVQADLDMSYYEVYSATATSFAFTATTLMASLSHPAHTYDIHGVDYGTTYYVRILPYDQFGVGIPTAEAYGTPLLIPNINVENELQESVTITDYAGNPATVTAKLYDGVLDSDGVFYSAGTQYIDFDYLLTNYFDRIGLWMDSSVATNTCALIIGTSDDSGSTWTWFSCAASSHSLTTDGYLTEKANEGAAWADYLTIDESFTWALLPNNVIANKVRFYFYLNEDQTVYEAVPSRILIAELAAIGHLSAISSNIGTMISGVLQSTNWGTNDGVMFDLDNRRLRFGGQTAPVIDIQESGVTITAGAIQSSNYNGSSAGYKFDLDNAEMKVYQSSGLKVKSGGGITIESGGGLNVSAGGDINLTGNDSNPAQVYFHGEDGGAILSMGTGGMGDYFGIYNETDGVSNMYVGKKPDGSSGINRRWHSIDFYSYINDAGGGRFYFSGYAGSTGESGAFGVQASRSYHSYFEPTYFSPSDNFNIENLHNNYITIYTTSSGRALLGTTSKYFFQVCCQNIYRDYEYALSCLPHVRNIYTGADVEDILDAFAALPNATDPDGWSKIDPATIPDSVRGPDVDWGDSDDPEYKDVPTIDTGRIRGLMLAAIRRIIKKMRQFDQRISALEDIS